MTMYWLGVATVPAVALAAFLLFVGWVRASDALRRRGITFDINWHRDPSGISDYTLRHDIWWERSFGPVFAGGWYHERPVYEAPSRALANRWIGFGRAEGPNIMVFRSRDLGELTIDAGHAVAD